MKICILGDTHLGCRGNSIHFHQYFRKFYNDIFFPYLIQNNINTIIQLGDLFDIRKQINFYSLFESRSYFFEPLKNNDMKMITLLGNHCLYYKHSLEINSSTLLLKEYDNIQVVDKFITKSFDGLQIDLIPWICEENKDKINSKIKSSQSKYCCGHFEIGGFEMDKGNIFKGGETTKQQLKNYEKVFSGHFHHKSDDGHVYYLGTPVELTWSDYNDIRGFHIFDTDTKELEFIKNPYSMFHKIIYDDSVQDSDYWNGYNFQSLSGNYIKIVVLNKNDLYLFDTVIDRLESVGVADISIVEDFRGLEDKDLEEDLDQSHDTITIINKTVDNLNHHLDNNKLKKIMKEVYIEALNVRSD